MAIVIYPKPLGRQKPKSPEQLNSGHPLANKLLFFLVGQSGGIPVDFGPYRCPYISSGLTPAVLPPPSAGQGMEEGSSVKFGGTGLELNYTLRGPQKVTNSGSSLASVFAIFRSTDWDGCIFSYGMRTDSQDAITFDVAVVGANHNVYLSDAFGTLNVILGNVGSNISKYQSVGFAQLSATSRRFMMNGNLSSPTGTQAAGAIGATQPVVIGQAYVNSVRESGSDFQGDIDCTAFWWKDLTNTDLRNLYVSPYDMFLQQSWIDRLLVKSTAAVTVKYPQLERFGFRGESRGMAG